MLPVLLQSKNSQIVFTCSGFNEQPPQKEAAFIFWNGMLNLELCYSKKETNLIVRFLICKLNFKRVVQLLHMLAAGFTSIALEPFRFLVSPLSSVTHKNKCRLQVALCLLSWSLNMSVAKFFAPEYRKV